MRFARRAPLPGGAAGAAGAERAGTAARQSSTVSPKRTPVLAPSAASACATGLGSGLMPSSMHAHTCRGTKR